MSVLEDLFGNPSPDEGEPASGESENPNWNGEAREEIASLFGSEEELESSPDLETLRRSLNEQDANDEEGEDDARDHLASLYETDKEEEEEEEDVDFDALRRAMAVASDDEDSGHPSGDDASERLNWLVDFVADKDDAPQETPADSSADPPLPDEQEKSEDDDQDNQKALSNQQALSDMAGIFQDGVMMRLLQREAIDVAQAVRAVRQKKSQPDRPLWDVLANLPDVDSQAVFAEAAFAEGIEKAEIGEDRPTTTFLETVLAVLPEPVRKQFTYLGLLPYAFDVDEDALQQCLVVASHYPTHPYVREFVEGLNLDVELRYAPQASINSRIEALQKVEAVEQENRRNGETAPSGPIGERLQDQLLDEEDERDAAEEPEKTVTDDEAAPNEEDASAKDDAGALLDDALGAPEAQTDDATVNGATADTGEAAPQADETQAPDEYDTLDGEEEKPDYSPPGDTNVSSSESSSTDTPEPQSDLQPEAAPEPAGLSPDPPADEDGEPKGLAAEIKRQEAVQQTREDEQPESALDGDEGAEVDVKTEAAETEAPASDDVSDEDTPGEVAPDVEEDVLEVIRREDRVVGMLLREGVVSVERAVQAHERKKKAGSEESLWRILAEQDEGDREAIYAGAASLYAFQSADLEEHALDVEFSRIVFDRFDEKQQERLLEMKVVPYKASAADATGTRRLVFVSHDPTRHDAHRLLHELPVEHFDLLYTPEEVVSDLIAEAFPKKNEYLQRMEEEGGIAVDLGMSHEEDDALIDEEELEAEISRSKLINLFEATLVEGVRQGASDVHIYPNADKKVEIHFRVDGRLKHWHTEEKVHPEALLAVIKDNAMNVDRFERDAAQDGFIQRKIDDALIRFRVSVLPIANASQEIRSESIVIRILDDRKVITDLSKLGLLEGALQKFEKAINQPNGMVILTGPTGSGKSTTLVASLHQVVTPEVNALTVEDPVEYIINGVRQIKLNHKLQLDGALRSILRHDPDIVMVGEMRDQKTAELAIKLANTGHLTFSTLHTNDAPSAISRLYKMGIEPFLIAYAINLVVAQRLIRTLCETCKTRDDDPDPVLLRELGFSEEEIDRTTFYKPGDDPHCPKCKGVGYAGRRAISEALYFNRTIRHMIVEAEGMINESAIREEARKDGLLTLQDSARQIVKMGETGTREMIRVVASEGS